MKAKVWRCTDNPVLVTTRFQFSRPKSRKKLKERWHTQKPDVDNCVKLHIDGLVTGGVLKDDKSVVSIQATKEYTDDEPCTLIIVEELESA
jgi:Holliday junction resolvase RusA-like endonuclease